MSPTLMRKYLDIINEQSGPPDPGDPFSRALIASASTGDVPGGSEYMNTLSRDKQAMLLRNVESFKNASLKNPLSLGPSGTTNLYNPNAQSDIERAAGQQAKLDSPVADTDPNQKLKSLQSKDIDKAYFTTKTAPVTKPDVKPTTTPAPAPATTTKPVAAAPAATNIQPAATPVDFNKQAGVMPVADTGLGKLSGGVSLSGAAGDYLNPLNPSMRAELANQSGGKFTADVGQNNQQLGYQQKFGADTTGQLAINRNAQGGMSAGIGAEKQLNKNWSATGGVSTPVAGKGDTQFNVGLKGQF